MSYCDEITAAMKKGRALETRIRTVRSTCMES